MRISDNGSFRDLRVGDQRALDLGGAEAMAGDVDHIIDPSGQPVKTVLVPACAVAGKIESREGREIGLDEPLVVAEDRAHDPWPGMGDTEVSFARTFDDLAVVVDDDRLDTKERPRRRARL